MKFISIILFSIVSLFANYEDGKKIFEQKCATCHKEFIPLNIVKENYFEKNNTLLNLKTPTVNMIVWAMMDGPKKIGDPSEPDIQIIEIERFLKDYLENPDRFNAICDDMQQEFDTQFDIAETDKNLIKVLWYILDNLVGKYETVKDLINDFVIYYL